MRAKPTPLSESTNALTLCQEFFSLKMLCFFFHSDDQKQMHKTKNLPWVNLLHKTHRDEKQLTKNGFGSVWLQRVSPGRSQNSFCGIRDSEIVSVCCYFWVVRCHTCSSSKCTCLVLGCYSMYRSLRLFELIYLGQAPATLQSRYSPFSSSTLSLTSIPKHCHSKSFPKWWQWQLLNNNGKGDVDDDYGDGCN